MTALQAGLRFGRFLLQRQRRLLLADGEPAKIGARAFDVLMALVDRSDRVVSKSELLDLVWPNVVVEENNLQVHISTLRKLLGPHAIATIPGRGYRFTLAPAETSSIDESVGQDVSNEASSGSGLIDETDIRSRAGKAIGDRDRLTNLSGTRAVLFGREADSDIVHGLLGHHRLVSLIGEGGIGKSSLALQVAERYLGAFADGVWLAELAPLTSGELVPTAIAAAFNVTLPAEKPARQALVHAFRYQKVLLVLDNCEHLIDGVAATSAALLAGCPGVRILATSQEFLRLPEEQAYRLAPLAYPAASETNEPMLYGAVELFVHRVRAVDRSFAVSPANVAAVIEICHRLDGIALAIEMAAARVPLLGVEGVRNRLDARFQLLSTRNRTALGHHQTLRAALEWSHSHLSSGEQVVFRRLGVFVGGFPLQALAEVVSDGGLDAWEAIERLGSLVDKSLVVPDGSPLPRYRLLETMRAYALERLAAAGETQELKSRHAAWVTSLCTELDEVTPTPRTFQWDVWLAPELDNVRAALDWAFGESGDLLQGMKLTRYAVQLFDLRLMLGEARERLDIALSHVDASTPPEIEALLSDMVSAPGLALDEHKKIAAAQRAAALWEGRNEGHFLNAELRRAGLLTVLGRAPEAEVILAIVKDRLEPWPALTAKYWNIRLMLAHASPAAAESAYVKARALFDQIGNAAASVIATANFARGLFFQGQTERAEAELRAVLKRAQCCGHPGVTSHIVGHLARVLIYQGRVDEAEPLIQQNLQLLPKLNYLFSFAPELALRAAWRGQWETAARLSGYCVAAHTSSGMREDITTPIQMLLNEMLAQHFDPDRISALRLEGASWVEPDVLAAAGVKLLLP